MKWIISFSKWFIERHLCKISVSPLSKIFCHREFNELNSLIPDVKVEDKFVQLKVEFDLLMKYEYFLSTENGKVKITGHCLDIAKLKKIV